MSRRDTWPDSALLWTDYPVPAGDFGSGSGSSEIRVNALVSSPDAGDESEHRMGGSQDETNRRG